MVDERHAPPCHCRKGWVCEEHRDQPEQHGGCTGAGMPCDHPQCPYWQGDNTLALDPDVQGMELFTSTRQQRRPRES